MALTGRLQSLPFSIFVRCADHLREIDHDWVSGFASNKNIELIEVSVDESWMCEPHNEIHQLGVQFPGRRYFWYLSAVKGLGRDMSWICWGLQRICINKFHQQTMSCLVNRSRNGKIVFMKHLRIISAQVANVQYSSLSWMPIPFAPPSETCTSKMPISVYQGNLAFL